MNRALETAIGGFISAYNITVGFVGLKWAWFTHALASVSSAHAAVNAWLSSISLVIGIVAGVVTIRSALKKK